MRKLAIVGAVMMGCWTGGGAKAPTAAAPRTVTAEVAGERFVVKVGDAVVVDEPAPRETFDDVRAVSDPVDGSDGRVVMTQLFRETGEDEFRRDVTVWLVDAVHAKVLWTGHGAFANSFDECQSYEAVPGAKVEGHTLVVVATDGVEKSVPESDRCDAVPVQTRELSRIALP